MRGATDYDFLIASGEIRIVGTPSLDAIIAPLRLGDLVLGALAVQSYTEGIGYTEQDVRVLEFVASHIATALTCARAIEEHVPAECRAGHHQQRAGGAGVQAGVRLDHRPGG